MPLKLLLGLLALPPLWFGEVPVASHLEPGTLAGVVHVTAGPSSGSAFLLAYGDGRYLVTARHVVSPALDEPGTPLTFRVGGRRGRPIREVALLADDARTDVAVFTFADDPQVPYFPEGAGLVPENDLELATSVFLIGYPASLKQTYGSSELRVVGGWVAGLEKRVPGSTVEYVDLDMPAVEHGHSGGPIVRLQQRVVAMAVQRRTGSVSPTIGATYAVPIKYVTSLIDGTPVDEDLTDLDEMLRDTTLVCGVCLEGKNDYDVWAQRIHRETGEALWGDQGIAVASSRLSEARCVSVPSLAGSVLVVHTIEQSDGSDADVLVQRVSRYGELLFEEGRSSLPVAGTARPERAPDAVSDGLGGAVVTWEVELQGGDRDVYAQRIDPDGAPRWGKDGVGVGTAGVPETAPSLVPDGSGGAIVVFERHLPGGDVDVVAQRVDGDGRLAWLSGTRSLEVAASARREEHPRAVPDGAGGAIVVFDADAPDGGRAVCAQRVSVHGDLLWNGGAPVRLSTWRATGARTAADVVPDGRGGAFVAFEVLTSDDPEDSDDVDLAVQHVTESGALAWGDAEDGDRAGVLAASTRFAERAPRLVADGEGGAVVAYVSGSENGDLDVWAQRVGADGALRWYGGRRSAEVALTFLSEHTISLVERSRDRVILCFEIDREDGRPSVGCQALDLDTGRALYGGGKLPVLVVEPAD